MLPAHLRALKVWVVLNVCMDGPGGGGDYEVREIIIQDENLELSDVKKRRGWGLHTCQFDVGECGKKPFLSKQEGSHSSWRTEYTQENKEQNIPLCLSVSEGS